MRPIDFFDQALDRYGQRVAVIDRDTTLTFAQLASMSHRIAASLDPIHDGPVPPVVGVWSVNDYRAIAATLGVMRAGGILMPLHSSTSAENVAQFVRTASPSVVFFHSTVLPQVEEVQKIITRGIRWVCLDDGRCGAANLTDLMDTSRLEYVDRWADAYANPERPAFIRQTSGTTGEAKTLVGNIASFAVSHMALQRYLAPSDVIVGLVATPFSHAAGLHALALLGLGGTLILHSGFDAEDVLTAIEKYRVSHMWLPVSAFHLLLAHPNVSRFDLRSLRQILLGASAPSPDKLRDAVRVFGPCIAVHYGQSEGGFLTWLDEHTLSAAAAGDHPERLASSGTTMNVARLSIMDEEGNHLAPRQIGEIVARGMSVKPFIRRIGEDDQNEMTMTQKYGWHHTGDLGYFDEAGYLYVVGRKKDMVITRGLKVPTADVERVVMEFSEIAECAVIGVPDAARGEAVKAIVRVRAGRPLSIEALLKHCRARLGSAQAPLTVETWPELPHTAVGKIDKMRIRRQFWVGTSRDIN